MPGSFLALPLTPSGLVQLLPLFGTDDANLVIFVDPDVEPALFATPYLGHLAGGRIRRLVGRIKHVSLVILCIGDMALRRVNTH